MLCAKGGETFSKAHMQNAAKYQLNAAKKQAVQHLYFVMYLQVDAASYGVLKKLETPIIQS